MEWWSDEKVGETERNRVVDPLSLEEADLMLVGDNRLALSALLARHRGAVQLIYIDPPFAVGRDQTMTVPVGKGGENHRVAMVAYRDAWVDDGGQYLRMMEERLVLMRALLCDTGVLFLHCDWRMHHQLRLLLDDLFGPERFLNEIVWHYYNKYSAGKHHLPRAHDNILVYAKGPTHRFNELRLPRDAPQRQLVRENVKGVLRNARDEEGRLRYRTVHDRKADDVWRIPQLQPASREWSGYATQKHHDLIERILMLASDRGDLVADFFSGSGTLPQVARRMGRRWIGCDMGAMAMHTTRRRLLPDETRVGKKNDGKSSAKGAPLRPYLVADLGRAMASHWHQETFSGEGAYRANVLSAFGAEATSENRPGVVHGWLEDVPCHVAGPDAVVNSDRVLALARAARAVGRSSVYVLAWAFDPLFWDDIARFGADDLGMIKPYLIPMELAGPGGGQPIFRPHPRLDLEAACVDDLKAECYRLTVRLKTLHRSPSRPAGASRWVEPPGDREDPLSLVEGWALDPAWDFEMPLRPRWWSYRSRRSRILDTESEPFEVPGGRGKLPFAVILADALGSVTHHAVRLDRPRAR